MAVSYLLTSLGDDIENADEETFLLFSQSIPSQNLGFVDPKAVSLEITIGNRDFVVQQSPSLLCSDRINGTTGAVVWKITPLFAEWITCADNIFSQTSVISTQSTVLELGCGITGILAMSLAPKVHKYIATDQEYVFKLLRQNMENNISNSRPKIASKSAKRKPGSTPAHTDAASNVSILSLDWETSDLANLPETLGCSPTVILACDCIYNESLIEPFVRTCADLCRSPGLEPKVCVIAQQLRSDAVFELWLAAFLVEFKVWRVKDELLTEGLKGGKGFVVHVGVLRETEGL